MTEPVDEYVQRAKDEVLLQTVTTFAEGRKILRKNVERERVKWLELEHARLLAIVGEMPPHVIEYRSARAADALRNLEHMRDLYAERLKGAAEYIRGECAK